MYFVEPRLSYKEKYALDLYLAKKYLFDNESKTVFDSAADFLNTYDPDTPNYVTSYYETEHPAVYIHTGDYIVDAGVSGDTSLTEEYLRETGETGRVFGIEPNPFLKERIKTSLKEYPNFILI